MAIDKQHNIFLFICDRCEDCIDTKEENFFKALQHIKAEGWQVRHIGVTRAAYEPTGEYTHMCNECVNEGA